MMKNNIIYWIFTGLLAALMAFSGIANLMSPPEAVAGLQHLGYPPYLLPFLGLAKLLGVLALLVPGFPRLREWAYAGFTFDMLGALYGSIAVGDSPSLWMPIFFGFVLLGGSYITYHRKSKTQALRMAAQTSKQHGQ